MSDSNSGIKSFFQSAGVILVFGFLFVITGYLIILASRLFMKPLKTKVGHCFWVGLAAWWLFFMPTWLATNQFPGNSPEKYDYKVTKNRVEFKKAPEEPLNAVWHWKIDDNGTQRNTPLYVHGKADGKNKMFHISEREDRITVPNLSEGGYEDGYWLGLRGGATGKSLYKRLKKPAERHSGMIVYGSIALALIGGLMLLDSYRIAFEVEKG